MKETYAFLSIIGLILIVTLFRFSDINLKKEVQEDIITINYIYALSHNEAKQDHFRELIKEYELANPNVRINPIFVGSPIEAMIKTVSLQKNTNGVDFAVLNNSELYTLLSMNLIVPLDDMIMKKYGMGLLEEYKPVFMENSIYNGYIWSIPFKRDVMVMYCNTGHLKGAGIENAVPPESWDQTFEYAKQLTVKNSDRVLRYGIGMPLENSNLLFRSIAAQLGQYSYSFRDNKGTNYKLNDDGSLGAANILYNLAKANMYSKRDIFNVEDVYEMFINRKASIIFAPSTLESRLQDEAGFDFTVSPLPKAARGASVTSGMNMYVMSGKSDEKYKHIFNFISWIMSPDINQRWINETGFFPVAEYLKSSKQSYINQDEIVSEACVFENSKIDKIVNDTILNIIYNNKNLDSEFTQTELEIHDKILEYYHR